MINGIPPLVSDRGGLPQTVGEAGRVIPLPSWLTEDSKQLPTAAEATPWFDAICELWDDPGAYHRASDVARQVAARCYSETVLRRRYLGYFASIESGPAAPLFEEPI